jgi:hypothetical protein
MPVEDARVQTVRRNKASELIKLLRNYYDAWQVPAGIWRLLKRLVLDSSRTVFGVSSFRLLGRRFLFFL